MPTFIYSAVSHSGQKTGGTKDSPNVSELARLLREEGLILISAKNASPAAKRATWKEILPALSGVPLVEKIMFAQNLAVMIGAGLSLIKAIEALAQQTRNKKFSNILQEIIASVRKGTSLADSLKKYPKVFSELFVNMVAVGEASGNLEEVLKVLANQMKKEHELLSRVKSAMIYPAVIICAMFGIGALMIATIVPKLKEIFTELNAELPLTTRIIIGISDFLSQRWLLSLFIVLGLTLLGWFIFKSRGGKDFFGRAILRAPIFGDIIKKVNSARLARTLGSLIKSGVPIVEALRIVSGTLGNLPFRQSLEFAAQEIQQGKNLSESLKKYSQIYPPMVNQMVQVGEETGTLDEILGKLAEFYEEEVANITRGLTSIIEPILMILIGAAVGLFAISMLQPMYSMMDSL